MKHHYTMAAIARIEEGASIEEVLRGLQKVMKKRRHISLYRPVLQDIVKHLHQNRSAAPTVTVANAKGITHYKKEIEKALETLAADKSESVTEIDATISGGYIVRYGTKQIDASYKRLLLRLYTSILRAHI